MVARSHECDFPSSVLCLPVCTSPRFTVSGNSREIDQLVESLRQHFRFMRLTMNYWNDCTQASLSRDPSAMFAPSAFVTCKQR